MYRHSPLESAASLKRLEKLAIKQQFETTLAKSTKSNPLLACGHKVFSQNDEDGLIAEICRRIHSHALGCFVEIGVGDGSENNTLHLLLKGWRGLWFGGESLAYKKLSNRLLFTHCWIDTDNVVGLITKKMADAGLDQIDLFSLDIDGNDWHIAKTLLENKIQPSIFVVEYNASMGPDVKWVMPYDAKHQWDGSAYFGASLSAFHELFDKHGYMLVACNITGANAFFVKKKFSPAFDDLPSSHTSMYMPANYLPYPFEGHPNSRKFLATVIAS